MAWVDSMRLRRAADKVRAVGWVNLFLSIGWTVFHASDGLGVFALSGLWAAAVMGITHSIAWIIDRRAERVVRR